MGVSRYLKAAIITKDGQQYYGPRPQGNVYPAVSDTYYDVRLGDSLPLIAYKMYGDVQYWWVLADFNAIIDPLQPLEVGSTLRAPSRARLFMEVLA